MVRATGLVAERIRFLFWLSYPPNEKQLVKSVDVNLSEFLTQNKKLRRGTVLETNSLQES